MKEHPPWRSHDYTGISNSPPPDSSHSPPAFVSGRRAAPSFLPLEMSCNNRNMRLRKSLEKNIQMKLSLTEHFNQEWQGSILLNILATVTLIFIFVWHFNTLYCKEWTIYDREKDNNFLQKKKKKREQKEERKKVCSERRGSREKGKKCNISGISINSLLTLFYLILSTIL